MLQICFLWRRLGLLFLASLVFCLVFHPYLIRPTDLLVAAVEIPLFTPPIDSQLVQQGIESYQAGRFPEAIAFWQQALPQIDEPKDRVIVYCNLALAYRQTGQLSRAIASWEQAIDFYRSQSDPTIRQPLARILTEQAQAYIDLGQHRRAISLLESALKIGSQNQELLTEAAAQGALGNAYWSLGNYEQAGVAQQRTLDIARELNNPSYIATALNNLGNLHISRSARYRYQAQLADLEGDDKEVVRLNQFAAQEQDLAKNSFEQSVQTARGVAVLEEIRGLMNLNRVMAQSSYPNQDLMVRNWQRLQELLAVTPDSREKAYTLINLAQQKLKFSRLKVESSASQVAQSQGRDRKETETFPPATLSYIATLEQGLAVARSIGDSRAESFALGSLGQLQEAAGNYNKAMELTRNAQFAAQQVNAPDSLYRWQWQAGRILKATGAKEQAITAYEQAIATLQSIRGDIVATKQELQFDFREQVEPVYRQLIDLLLSSRPSGVKSQMSQNVISPIKKAVDTLELLKLAELENFFGDECVQIALAENDGSEDLIDQHTVVVYSVILDNQVEMILRSPDGSMTPYRIPVSKATLEKDVDQLRYLLELRATEEYLPQAQKIYDLLIRPLEADLAAAKLRTLVFINDGVLRKVPMAALHDGQEFLIQKYPLANTPSLSLTTRKIPNQSKLEALILGLTVARSPFAPLSNVQAEVKAVKEILGGTVLLDQAFTLPNLQANLQKKSYPIVHMATHGKFGVDAQSTFLVGYDQRISIEQIDNLLRSRKKQPPVKLLTLSACQTAAGDNRSALGIAGVAVRAGVETALATLWYINDEATVPLIEEFYRQLLQPNLTKAEALRKAQIKMITDLNYNHPAVWSPFILIGNWL